MKLALQSVYPFIVVILLFFLVLETGGTLYAQSSSSLPVEVPQLSFTAIPGRGDLSVAEDAQGNRWIKGLISPAMRNIPLVFHIPSMQVAEYQLYVDRGNGFVTIPKNINHSQQKIQSRYPLYFFKSTAAAYYLHIKDKPFKALDAAIDKPTEFIKSESVNLMRNSLYYGLAIMSMIFNFVLYYIFRDKRFILYSFLQLSLFISFLYQDGMFYFFSQGTFIVPYFLLWNIAVAATLSSVFAYYFLDMRHKMPHFRRIFLYLTAVLFTFVLLYTLTDILLFRHLACVLIFGLPGICFYHAIRTCRQDVYARFLILSFGLIAFTSACFLLNRYIDSDFLSYFDINTIRLASAIEMICVSLALVFKVKAVQEENEAYKEKLNRHLYELEKLKKAQQQYLKNEENIADIQQEVIAELKQHYDLTDREVDVLLCIWNRMTNQEITDQLYISINTTKYHIRRLYLKLEVNSREEVHRVIQNLIIV
ncbi:hypothetical protein G5B30_15930 [Sphingobacterium sp. SGG-5]|uniref:7TM diverse intracellular signaling domain-containing protein n=1 Tax=Sphingobacterium sp. SGG-5 TaxID=2710881 RepID=UPI0013EC57EC|nr:7TM diverse intracellular signaling domain-containing protein [Sphingobacterium sp. SGG-5]NGM63400.1 hypothetical protein [Sphingobacterium sp. SGG-5]